MMQPKRRTTVAFAAIALVTAAVATTLVLRRERPLATAPQERAPVLTTDPTAIKRNRLRRDSIAAEGLSLIPGTPGLYHVVLGSDTPTVVILHGGPGLSHNYLRPEWDQLSDSNRLVYYDQNGCGRSGRVPPYTWRRHIQDLDRLVQHVSPDRRVILAGSSWGSMLALLYSYEHPHRVRALVLSGLPRHPFRRATDSIRTPEPKRPGRYSREDSVNMGLKVGPYPGRGSALDMRIQARAGFEHCHDIWATTLESLYDAPPLDNLRRIAVPTLLLRGADTVSYVGDGARELSQVLPNAQLVTISGAGHGPWLEQPKTFFAHVRRFLSGISGS